VFNRSKKVDNIIKSLTLIHFYVKSRNKAGYTDINKECEEFFAGLFNIIMRSNFERLEKIKKNHIAIDLGDDYNLSAMQITSTNKKSKIKKTIAAFESENTKLYKKYSNTLFIFIIGEKLNYNKPVKIDETKGYKLVIIDIYDLIDNIINTSNDNIINEVISYIKRNMTNHFLNEMVYNTGYLPMEEKDQIKVFKHGNSFIKYYYNNESTTSSDIEFIRHNLKFFGNKLNEIDKIARQLLYSLIQKRNKSHSDEFSIKVEKHVGQLIKQLEQEEIYNCLEINGFIKDSEIDKNGMVYECKEVYCEKIDSMLLPTIISFCDDEKRNLQELIVELDLTQLD